MLVELFLQGSICFVVAQFDFASFLGLNAEALLHVVVPVPFVFRSIGIEESSKALSLALHPVSIISVTKDLKLGSIFQPHVRSLAVLLVVVPVSHILLVGGYPHHGAESFLNVVDPHAFVVVARRVCHLSEAMFNAVAKGSLEKRAIAELYFPFAITLAVLPLSAVSCVFRLGDEFAIALLATVVDFADVSAAIRPGVFAFAFDDVVFKFAVVDYA